MVNHNTVARHKDGFDTMLVLAAVYASIAALAVFIAFAEARITGGNEARVKAETTSIHFAAIMICMYLVVLFMRSS